MNLPEEISVAILSDSNRNIPYRNLYIHKGAYPQFRTFVQPWEITITKDGVFFYGVEIHVRNDPLHVWRLS